METKCLDISVNLIDGYRYTSEERISDLFETIDYIIYNPYISVQVQVKVCLEY